MGRLPKKYSQAERLTPNHELPMIPRLSKSKYMSGNQCHKKLYLEIRSPELATETVQPIRAID